jgi:hypothetical protein
MGIRRAFSWLKRLRFLLSKSFFVSWGIAFGFLIGVFSGLAQLLPNFKLSLKLSITLIAISAGIGTVYSFRKNRSVHLSVDDLLPDSPSLAPALSLECSFDRNVIAQVLDLAKRIYPGVVPPPPDRYEQFVSVNRAILVCLFNANREVVGYFDVYPLRPGFLAFLIDGTYGELDVRKEHILAPEDAWLAPALYLAGLAVEDPTTVKGKRYASILCWGLIRYFQHYYGAPRKLEVFAEGVTKQGAAILRRFGFTLHSSATGRKDPYPLFRASTTSEFMSQAIASIPDWSHVCRLVWAENKRSQPSDEPGWQI